jgi:hypothetical protein
MPQAESPSLLVIMPIDPSENGEGSYTEMMGVK